ncbi:MAG: diguanylate cyclase [Candidatus Omnitrophica bacterium]|nr:diguanylate cyclase [Candidatus Omnitrophota bacterium]
MSMTVLVVEDSQRSFEQVVQILSSESHVVIHAANGAKALAFLEDNVPDLILLDILLPDTDGFELCRRIRGEARFEHIPVIFHTSSASADNKLLALQLGATDFIVKNNTDEREILLRVRNCLRLKKLYDEMLRLAIVDVQTKAYNRRYLQKRLLDEFERAKRYRRELSFLILDIDGFRQINAAHGRPLGSIVLKNVAGILRFNTRNADIVCRYGNDEFALLLPETNLAGARILGERLRELIARTDVGTAQQPLTVTVSAGISSLVDGQVSGMDEFMTQAEVAMHTVKRRQGNAVKVYGK